MDIQIRKFKAEDAPEFLEAVVESVDHLSQWLMWCSDEYDIGDAEEWVSTAEEHWQAGTDYRCIIEEVSSNRIVGCVGINQIVALHKVGNLGYWVRHSAINRGACSRAASALTRLAFTELGVQRIEITIHPDNRPSNIVARKIGAVYEGTFRNKIVFNCEPAPANCYSIIPSDYDL